MGGKGFANSPTMEDSVKITPRRLYRIPLYGISRYRSSAVAGVAAGGGVCLPMTKNTTQPPHPGQILRNDFMEPAGLSATALAKALGVTAPRINDILLERRGVTADTALRLARYFGGEPLDWLLRQAVYDLRVAKSANGSAVEREVTPRAARIKKAHDPGSR